MNDQGAVAQTEAPQKPPIDRSHKNVPITKVVDQLERNPGITYRELGKLNDTSHVAMIKLLSRHGITRENVEEYKTGRADLLAGLQERMLAAITEEDLTKASLRDKIISTGVLYDKERLERGQSTVNAATVISLSVDPGSLDDDL